MPFTLCWRRHPEPRLGCRSSRGRCNSSRTAPASPQCLLGRTALDTGPPPAVGLKSFYEPLIHGFDQRGGVWRGEHYSDIELKIDNKRRMSGSIIFLEKIWKGMLFTKECPSISLARQFGRASRRSWIAHAVLLLR